MDGKRKEFLELTQGKMDIEPYWRAFTRLARYAPRDVTNDEDKQELFRKGMNPTLRYEMLPFTFPSFQDLYNQAFTLERGRKEMEAAVKKDSGDSRAPSSGFKRKRLVFIPYSAVPKSSGYVPRPPAPPATSTYGGGQGYRPPGGNPQIGRASCRERV